MQMSQKNIRLGNVAFFTVIVAMSCFSTMAKSEITLEVGGITYADPSVTALTHELVALNQSRLVRKQAAVQRQLYSRECNAAVCRAEPSSSTNS